MLRFIRRRRHAVQDSEIHKLRETFGLSAQFEHGVPHNVHRLAVDGKLGLVAIITRSGLVELYDKFGQKTVLLKKLGAPSTYFEFVEGANQLVIVCVPHSSSNLPESYHVLRTDDAESCSTICRPKTSPLATCFCVSRLPDYEHCLLIGSADCSLNILDLTARSSSLEIQPLISVAELFREVELKGLHTNPDLHPITDIATTSKLLICCFGNTLVAVICAKSRTFIKTIEMSRRYTVMNVNEDIGVALFVSTETIYALTLSDLSVQKSGLEARGFERTERFHVVTSARTNNLLVMYSTGIPSRLMRRSSSFTINDQGKLFSFMPSSDLQDVRLVYDSKRKATAVLLLCEHELISIDLMDPQFRCMNLNFLRCVDSSPVTSIRVEKLEADDPVFSASSSQYSQRRTLFEISGLEEHSTKQLDCVVFTGHENSDICIWEMRNGSQKLLQMFRATDYIMAPTADVETGLESNEQTAEEMNAIKLEISFTETLHDKKIHATKNNNPELEASKLEMSPSMLWRDAKSVELVEVGIYDERCEDDRLAVESFHYCAKRQTLICGLHGGMIVVSTVSNSECDFSNEPENNVELVEVMISNVEKSSNAPLPLQFKKSREWSSSIFIPHLFQLALLPQTPVRCVSYCEESCVTVAGTSTGIGIFNSMSGRVIFSKNFLSLGDIEVILTEEKPLTRLKTMKQTVRKTFRKRSLRMSRTGNQRPERQVEFRDSQMPMNNGVRCMHFHSTSTNKRLLFVGTAHATVYLFEIDSADSCTLYKEIRLSHRAPIIAIDVVKVEKQTRVVVFTEEQIRFFFLDGITIRPAKFSCKLTAKCGIQLRRACVCRSAESSFQFLCMLCNDGNVLAISATDPRVRIHERFTEAANTSALRISAMSSAAEFAYLGPNSSSLIFRSCNPSHGDSSWKTED